MAPVKRNKTGQERGEPGMVVLRILKWMVIVVAALALLALAAGQAGLLKGRQPSDLGLKEGRLKAPSATENSVSSQAALHGDHPMRAYALIEPFRYAGDAAAALERVKAVALAMDGAALVNAGPGYLHVQFQSRWFKFVDDAEFAIDDAAKVIHVRSAARMGRKDFGVNRARVEAIRSKLGA